VHTILIDVEVSLNMPTGNKIIRAITAEIIAIETHLIQWNISLSVLIFLALNTPKALQKYVPTLAANIDK
jgi:hypothetical protein